MEIDFNELERNVLTQMENLVAPVDKDDVYAQLADTFRKEALRISIMVLAEYHRMKQV